MSDSLKTDYAKLQNVLLLSYGVLWATLMVCIILFFVWYKQMSTTSEKGSDDGMYDFLNKYYKEFNPIG